VRRCACNGGRCARPRSGETWGRTEHRASQRASRDHGECGTKEKRERSASQRAGHGEHELDGHGGLTAARTAGAADSHSKRRCEQAQTNRKDKAEVMALANASTSELWQYSAPAGRSSAGAAKGRRPQATAGSELYSRGDVQEGNSSHLASATAKHEVA
jgi:hypothetical protein